MFSSLIYLEKLIILNLKKILKYYKNFYRSIGDEKDMDYLKENNILKNIRI